MLLSACLVFHTYFAGPAGVFPILFLAVGTYFTGLSRNKTACIVWITTCVSALIFYKYVYFISQNILGLAFPELGAEASRAAKTLLPAFPPLAISFFTFEFVHYLVDIYRGRRPIKSAVSFSLFAVFWPSLVAGPVKRYRQFLPSLSRGMRNVSSADVTAGMLRVASGILKKFAADTLTGWIGSFDAIYDSQGIGMRWIFLIALGLRILLDFSGYSDMAIGFSRMMGIRVPENFQWPYLAKSINDFWR